MTSPYVFNDKDKAPEGMTLRDYFAGQVIGKIEGLTMERSAVVAYEVADAMLKVRDQS